MTFVKYLSGITLRAGALCRCTPFGYLDNHGPGLLQGQPRSMARPGASGRVLKPARTLTPSTTPLLFTSQACLQLIPAMASSAHPAFPSRSYASNLGKLPDRSLGTTFGASTTQQQRENARQEREREKLERERLEREEQNRLTEEQREEIKEAVRRSALRPP